MLAIAAAQNLGHFRERSDALGVRRRVGTRIFRKGFSRDLRNLAISEKLETPSKESPEKQCSNFD